MKLPFVKLKQLYRSARRRFFSRSRPNGRYYVVSMSIGEIEEALGEQHYAPNWELSYYYRGEILNLAQVSWHRDETLDEFTWWQVHVRGWRHDNGIWLQAHWELEPTEHSHAHLEGVGYSTGAGNVALEMAFEEAGIDYEIAEYTKR